MDYIRRKLEPIIARHIARGKSVLLLGPRQVGKATLLAGVEADLRITLLDRSTRLRLEKAPEVLVQEVQALRSLIGRRVLLVMDEIQKIPELLDPIQHLIDEKTAQVILTGSSARKLRRQQEVNLLPGRVVSLRLDPLNIAELPQTKLEDLLYYGSLPGIFTNTDPADKDVDLRSYVEAYLDEEVRAEALVRQIGDFARFLELAGIEAGNILNYSGIASDIGVSKNTIASYFEILFDCLVAERVDPISQSRTRKKLTKTCRYLFFDLGVRRFCAGEGVGQSIDHLGAHFEQFIGLELIRLTRQSAPEGRLRFWRDPDGPEVDWVIERHGRYTPIEVKWTDAPELKHAKHLITFLEEYARQASEAYIICRTPKKLKISRNLHAVPWQDLPDLVAGI